MIDSIETSEADALPFKSTAPAKRKRSADPAPVTDDLYRAGYLAAIADAKAACLSYNDRRQWMSQAAKQTFANHIEKLTPKDPHG